METPRRSDWQYSLGGFLLLVALCALLLGVINHLETTYRIEVSFTSLPATDHALKDWLSQQEGVRRVAVERRGNRVLMHFTKPRGGYNIAQPPYERLGYKGLQSASFTIGSISLPGAFWNMVRANPWPWGLITLGASAWALRIAWLRLRSKGPANLPSAPRAA